MNNLKGKHIILDTNIIIRFPSILKRSEEFKISIPSIVIAELRMRSEKGSDWKKLNSLVEYALKNEMVIVTDHNNKDDNFLEYINYKNGPDETDLVILNLTKRLKAKGENVVLATEDKVLQRMCASMGINTIGLQGLKNEVKSISNAKPSTDLNQKIEEIEKQSKKRIIMTVLFLIAFAFLMFILGKYSDEIINRINIWGKIGILVLVSFLIYWVRCNLRLAYGLAEFGLGVYIAYPLFNLQSISTTFISLLAALFIMIRGLDNITTGISETRYITGTLVEKGWKSIFRLK
ncbi:hypothetical protein FQP34_07060 [Peribacillus simplex]|uniref:PIN domain-containing protein n=1 Tax=Peribacillus simplex TaxID=1478 RepID=A0A8B5Y397_9BACI|nr:PIN domain-containing protein [Peribacillus simplex]TVX83308.1 hypothetical protein FQP34_07060 [Peribacillus simplex]